MENLSNSRGVKTIHDILHNGLIKTYPDGSGAILIAGKGIFRDPGYEDVTDDITGRKSRKKGKPLAALLDLPLDPEISYERSEREGMRGLVAGDPLPADPANLERSIWRARAKVRDIALSSDFSWFVTLTLDRRKVDRYDMAQITKKLNSWLNNRVKRYGLAYVLVPERHKDGAVHFHGFFNNALDDCMTDSGHLDKMGHHVFNCEAWTLGFTTAVKLYGEYDRAVSYVCKYIGKSPEKVGGRWYYSGGALGSPRVARFTCCPEDYAELDGYRFNMANGTPVLLINFDSPAQFGRMIGGEEHG